MKDTKEILRLGLQGKLSQRKISASVGVGKTTVQETLSRATEMGLTWEKASSLRSRQIVDLLFPASPEATSQASPDFAWVRKELHRKGVTLQLVWLEYRESEPDGLSYSQFCHRFRLWERRTRLSMRQVHQAGEKAFVDFAGLTIPWIDMETGEIHEAQLFIAVMGASSYTFATCVDSQKIPDWIQCHIRMLEFFGGVPELLVPDNLKSAVDKPCRYDPKLNSTYRELSEHYGCAVLPARVRKPKDKSKAEVGVQIAERWICARLRKMTFTSIHEINEAIRPLLERINQKVMKSYRASRHELFQSIDRPAMKALTPVRFEVCEWSKARVNIDYHIEVLGHYYSVPFQLIGRTVDVKITRQMICVVHEDLRVAAHARSFVLGKHTTIAEHMPPKHREHMKWTPERILSWAGKSGPATRSVCEAILNARPHPEQGFRAVLGIIRLAEKYSDARLEGACKYALNRLPLNYRTIKTILQNRKDLEPTTQCERRPTPRLVHENIRGQAYYQ